jgi:hypothetical protein
MISLDTPCAKCGAIERSVVTRDCLPCNRARFRAYRAKKPILPVAIRPERAVFCSYCGERTSFPVRDHVIPYAYSGRLTERGPGHIGGGNTVPCCIECNTFLGSRLIVTVTDRAAYLFANHKVQKRYSKKRLLRLAALAEAG